MNTKTTESNGSLMGPIKAREVILGLAIASMAIRIFINAEHLLRSSADSLTAQISQILLGFGIWAFLIRKVWISPRRWGFGVGLLLLGTLAFQVYILRLAAGAADRGEAAIHFSVKAMIIHEIPTVIVLVLCLLLRWVYPAKIRE